MPNDFKWDSFEQAPASKDFNWDAHEAVSSPAKQDPEISQLEAAARGGLSGALTSAVNIPIAGLDTAADVIRGGDYSPLTEIFKGHLDKEKAREKLAVQQHPGTYYGSMVAGGFASPVGRVLKGAGLIGEAVKDAPLLSRLFQAGRSGAAIGGAYGAGEALTDVDTNKSLGENVSQAAGKIVPGVVGGATIGTALHGVGEGISAGIQTASEKEIPLLSNAARRYQLGREGVNLYNDAQMAARTADRFKSLGQHGLAAEVDDITSGMNKVLESAKAEGQTVNYQEVLGKAEELRIKAEGMEPGEIRDELLDLSGRVKDSVNQFKEKIPVTTLTKTGEREIPAVPAQEEVPATPSTEQRLNQEMEEFNQQAKLTEASGGDAQPKMRIARQKNDQGEDFLRKIIDAPERSSEAVAPAGSPKAFNIKMPDQEFIETFAKKAGISLEDAESYLRKQAEDKARSQAERFLSQKADVSKLQGTQPIQNISQTPENILAEHYEPNVAGQELPKSKPQGMWEKAMPEVPGQEYHPGAPPETQAIYEPRTEMVMSPELEPAAARDARSMFGKNRSFDTSAAREESQNMYNAMSDSLYKGIPEYQPYSDKYKLFLSAMEDLGLKIQSPKDFFVQTADELVSGEKGSQFNPDIPKQLKNIFNQAVDDPSVRERLQLGFDKLEKAGFKGLETLKANAEQAIHDESLSVGLVNPKSLMAPIGSPQYKFVKSLTAIPNAVGLGLNKLEGAMGGQGLASGTTNALAKTPAVDFLGNKIKDVPGNFYKYIVAADDDTLKQISASLQGTPYQYQGDTLTQAIDGNDQQKKNSMIFSIANNPEIKKVIQGKANGM